MSSARTLIVAGVQSFFGVVILQAALTDKGTQSTSTAVQLLVGAADRFLNPSVPAIGRRKKKTAASSTTSSSSSSSSASATSSPTTTTTTTAPTSTATRPTSTAPQAPAGGRPTTTGRTDTEDLPGHRTPVTR